MLAQEIAKCGSTLEAALLYSIAGMSVIPLQGKKPRGAWQAFQTTRANSLRIKSWFGTPGNVGVICGRVSGNLVVMDFDGLAGLDMFYAAFPKYQQTFTVATGSGNGAHLYFRVDELPQTTRVMAYQGCNLEMRVEGCYVVAPPSIHPDTNKPYVISRTHDIMQLPHMRDVKDWLYWILRKKQSTDQNVKQLQPVKPTVAPGEGRIKWWVKALEYEARDIRMAPNGARNNQLNRAAYNMGQLVGDNLLSRSEVESALLTAALAAGLKDEEALRTIGSGLQAGMANPRSQQWRNRR